MQSFYCTPDTLHSTLQEHGVAIIPSVLGAEECAAMNRGFADAVEHLTQAWDGLEVDAADFPRKPRTLRVGDPDTWRMWSSYFHPMHSMLCQHHGIGHAQYVWDLRQNPRIVDIFARLWSAARGRRYTREDLIVSFDAVSYHFPPEHFPLAKGERRPGVFRKSWHHSDQSFTRNDFECVQSWVTGYDVAPGDATLSVLVGSHRRHAAFREHFGVTNKQDWYKLSDAERAFYADCPEVLVTCPAGSLVFWDSRTIHCGVESRADRPAGRAKPRHVVYLCYQPREDASDKICARRRAAFADLRMTTHWPAHAKLFPRQPRTYGAKLLPMTALPAPALTPLGHALVGLDR